jgi:CRISPR-associated protein Csx10
MKLYRVTAELLSPLLVQENKRSNAPDSREYLPGSTLRGALAAHYLRQVGSAEDKCFRSLFLENGFNFPNLYPVDSADEISFQIPMTAFSCKRKPGFKATDSHGVKDGLVHLAAEAILKKAFLSKEKCKECKQDVKPYAGFWNGNITKAVKSVPVVAAQRHTGIDRTTGTVANSIFYITQGISEYRLKKKGGLEFVPQYLSGGIYLTEDRAEMLSDLFGRGSVFAGADCTSGMGEMKMQLSEHKERIFSLPEWNKHFRNKLKTLSPDAEKAQAGIYFSIGLDSHTIMIDSLLRPVSDFVPEFPDISIVTRVVRPQTVYGWQSCWKLPRNIDMAACRGSVYLFLYKGSNIDKLQEYLRDIGINGIGLRRTEGFGRIRVCDSLHTQEVL